MSTGIHHMGDVPYRFGCSRIWPKRLRYKQWWHCEYIRFDTALPHDSDNAGKIQRTLTKIRVVDTVDLLLVAASLSTVSRQAVETLVATDVEKWLNDATKIRIENEYQQKGIVFLEYLLAEIALSIKTYKGGESSTKSKLWSAHKYCQLTCVQSRWTDAGECEFFG